MAETELAGAVAQGSSLDATPDTTALESDGAIDIVLDDDIIDIDQGPTLPHEKSHISRVFSMVRQPIKQVGFCGVMKQIFYPIKDFKTTFNDKTGDGVTEIILCPEAFRMCYYVYFILFLFVAIAISSTWAETDLDDNPIINRFGSNNLCIYLDDPPFSTFGLTLWFPALMLLLSYEILDFVRMYDHYLDTGSDKMHRAFYIYYCLSTAVEMISVIVFPQVFATSPTENIYVHSMPYFMLLYALWFIAMKRFLYLWRVNWFEQKDPSIWYMSCVYVALSAVTVVIKMVTGISNLFGAKLYEYDSWDEWLGPIVEFNGNFYLFLNLLCPLIIYGIIGAEMDTLVITINRVRHSIAQKRQVST